MIKYKVCKEHLSHPALGKYKTYGIAVYSGKTLLRRISDISTDKRSVRKLCKLCNKLNLSAEHIDDVVEDSLCI